MRLISGKWQCIVVISMCFARGLLGQGTVVPTTGLDSVFAVSERKFGIILGIHEFADGRVLVNDGGARQILILSKSLSSESIVFDSSSANGKYYGPRASPILHGLADSVFFVDGQASALVLIGPGGAVKRTLSLPKASDARFIAASSSGFDGRGQIVYRGGPSMKGQNPDHNPVSRAKLLEKDSIPIIRANFESRTVDTVAKLVLPVDRRLDVREVNGQAQTTMLHNPFFFIDEWAVTSDGNIAVVRGDTYRVELIDSFGKKTLGPKLPFDWRPISEVEKKKLLDSAQAAFESRNAIAATKDVSGSATSARGLTITALSGLATTHLWVTPGEMIDYWPPLRQGSVTSDREGNIWILPSTSRSGSDGILVYDVVNAKGELVFRVRMPRGRSIVGFGRNGLVYLTSKNQAGSWELESRNLLNAKGVGSSSHAAKRTNRE